MENNAPIFSKTNNMKFFRTLNKRVNDYFKENNIKKTGNWKLHLKTICMFSLFLNTLLFNSHFRPAALGLLATHRCDRNRNGRSGHECNARWKPRSLFNQKLG